MPQPMAQVDVAENLCRLAKEFRSGDPVMASSIRKEFKSKSKNDVVRAVVYLMEVIGSRDEQFKALQTDNKDLKEILKLNDIDLEEGFKDLEAKEKANAQGTSGQDGVAAAGSDQVSGNFGIDTNSGSSEAQT